MVYFFVVIIIIVILNFLCSLIGCLIFFVCEDEIAVELVGVNMIKIKIIVFVFGVIIVSIVGLFQVGFIGLVVLKDYIFINLINVLIIVVFGGFGFIIGVIVLVIVLGILNMFF